MQLRPAVFIDKDGTLVKDVPYNVDPALVVLTPGAGPALRALRDAGFALVLVSNQSGIATGRFPASALRAVEDRLAELLAPHGVSLDAAYYCPHAPGPDGRPACPCRKPAPGLFFQAARERHLHLRRSWMIGDILNDVEAGRAAGCRTILLDNGGETEWKISPGRLPHFTARTMVEAAKTILTADRPSVMTTGGTVVADSPPGDHE
jgi:histidinol-phosphate phosphatase family protein